MTVFSWFSAKLRYVVLVGDGKADTVNDRVYVFRSHDFSDAFQRALSIGKGHEESYPNEAGDVVRWRFIDVTTLDIIRQDDLDGAEVYSEPIPLGVDSMLDSGALPNPAESKPIQTI